jgi:hypothetical protein
MEILSDSKINLHVEIYRGKKAIEKLDSLNLEQ